MGRRLSPNNTEYIDLGKPKGGAPIKYRSSTLSFEYAFRLSNELSDNGNKKEEICMGCSRNG